MPLAELTALLARQFAESATVAERRQRDDYVALAAEVEGTLESFLDRAIGCTDVERRAIAARYLADVVAPLLPRSKRVPRPVNNAAIRFDTAGLDRLIEHFGETIRNAAVSATAAGTWMIARDRLEQFISDKLRRDAEVRYRDVRALLRTGMPRTQILGGKLSAKVLLDEDGGGSVVARLVNAEMGKECGDAISTLTVDLSVSAFPPFE